MSFVFLDWFEKDCEERDAENARVLEEIEGRTSEIQKVFSDFHRASKEYRNKAMACAENLLAELNDNDSSDATVFEAAIRKLPEYDIACESSYKKALHAIKALSLSPSARKILVSKLDNRMDEELGVVRRYHANARGILEHALWKRLIAKHTFSEAFNSLGEMSAVTILTRTWLKAKESDDVRGLYYVASRFESLLCFVDWVVQEAVVSTNGDQNWEHASVAKKIISAVKTNNCEFDVFVK